MDASSFKTDEHKPHGDCQYFQRSIPVNSSISRIYNEKVYHRDREKMIIIKFKTFQNKKIVMHSLKELFHF